MKLQKYEFTFAARLAPADQSFGRQFLSAVGLPLRSARFLLSCRPLWGAASLPALINGTVFVALAVTLIVHSATIMNALWVLPDGGLAVLWWAVRLILIPILLVGAYFTTLMMSAVVASPANDRLSQRLEEVLGVDVPVVGGLLRTSVVSGLRGVAQATANVTILLTLMLPILLMNLVPGIGSLAATLLGGVVASFFIALEYTDWTLERRGFGWREKWGLLWHHRAIVLGFGFGTSVMMWIPLINLLAMPIAVIGGTVLALELNQRRLDGTTQ